MCLHYTDGHTTEDIIFRWESGITDVSVEKEEMAQREYKGSELKSELEKLTSGQPKIKCIMSFCKVKTFSPILRIDKARCLIRVRAPNSVFSSIKRLGGLLYSSCMGC